MDETKLYWTVVVTLVGAGWVITTFLRDRQSQRVERSSAMVSRLIEGDKLSMERAEIQKYLSQTAGRDEVFFRDPEILKETLFYQAKAFAYQQLNMFDEILSVSSQRDEAKTFIGKLANVLLKPAALIEIADWEEYMREKMRHPLYRSIIKNEGHIFGKCLRDFWTNNRQSIEARAADPFLW